MYNDAAVTSCAHNLKVQQNSSLLECHHVYYFIIQLSGVLSTGITQVCEQLRSRCSCLSMHTPWFNGTLVQVHTF